VITRRTLLTAGLAGVALTAACTDDNGPKPRMVVAAGEYGGVYRPLGRALAGTMTPYWRGAATTTAGSVENLQRLHDGKAQLAFTTVDTAANAMGSLGSFTSKVAVRALAGLYSDYVHLVVPSDSSVDTLAGLAGRSVATGAPGSGTEVVAMRMLAATGITRFGFEQHRLGVRDSVEALRDGIVDAFFFCGGLPAPAIGYLINDVGMPLRLVDLGGYVDVMQSQYGEVYTSGWIPNSTYGTPSVNTVCVPNVLAVMPDLDSDTAYALTRLLFAAKNHLAAAHPEGRQLDPRAALATYPVPMHPGAEHYYRTLKLV